jgi:superfamily II DNA or RNA helicase
MIEFKQIIGRGTRLYDGKDYFTIYDFVKRTTTSMIRSGTANRLSRSRQCQDQGFPNFPRPSRPDRDPNPILRARGSK